jgi:hypothetical protein
VSGFGPHYDVHDVFIFPISGAKHWKIYPPIFDLPHASQLFRPQMFTNSAPLLELDIEPGELLYSSRGYVHTTNTGNRAYAHATVGVTVYTRVELLAIWLQSSKNEVDFRRALPPGFAYRPELKQEPNNVFARLVAEFHAKLDGEHLIESFLQRVRDGYLGQRAAGAGFDANVVVIGPRSELKVLPRDRYRLCEEDGGIVPKFEGKALPHAASRPRCSRRHVQEPPVPTRGPRRRFERGDETGLGALSAQGRLFDPVRIVPYAAEQKPTAQRRLNAVAAARKSRRLFEWKCLKRSTQGCSRQLA